jgi:hypothetical protein
VVAGAPASDLAACLNEVPASFIDHFKELTVTWGTTPATSSSNVIPISRGAGPDHADAAVAEPPTAHAEVSLTEHSAMSPPVNPQGEDIEREHALESMFRVVDSLSSAARASKTIDDLLTNKQTPTGSMAARTTALHASQLTNKAAHDLRHIAEAPLESRERDTVMTAWAITDEAADMLRTIASFDHPEQFGGLGQVHNALLDSAKQLYNLATHELNPKYDGS